MSGVAFNRLVVMAYTFMCKFEVYTVAPFNDGQRRNEVHDCLDMEQLLYILGIQTNQSTLENRT